MTCKDCYNQPICIWTRYRHRTKAQKTCPYFIEETLYIKYKKENQENENYS